MRIKSVEFFNIKAFKNTFWDLDKTKVIVGQNNHGKSSLVKALHILLDEKQISDESIDAKIIDEKIATQLIPQFSHIKGSKKITLFIEDLRGDFQLTFSITKDYKIEFDSNAKKTSMTASDLFKQVRQWNKMVLIPAVRDASSKQVDELFKGAFSQYGTDYLIHKKAGGSPLPYRKLKGLGKTVLEDIKPIIDEKFLPNLSKHLGFSFEDKFKLSFRGDIDTTLEWIRTNLELGSIVDEGEESVIPLSEVGTGIQSGVLLALHRLRLNAQNNTKVNYIFAIEEPEAFLHPQKQKELYLNLKEMECDNIRVYVTTHSPVIVSQADFSSIGIVRKEKPYSKLFVPEPKDAIEESKFNELSNEINSQIFYAEKLVLVEGVGDKIVLEELMRRSFGSKSASVTVVSAGGNRNFSPYLRMIRSIQKVGIPCLIVTDFDSLVKSESESGDRPIIKGLRLADYIFNSEALETKVDQIINQSSTIEAEYREISQLASNLFKKSGAQVHVLPCDLEYLLVNDENRADVGEILNQIDNSKDFDSGYSISSLRRLIGSKGIPMVKNENPTFKKPFIHRKIASEMRVKDFSFDIKNLLDAIKGLSI